MFENVHLEFLQTIDTACSIIPPTVKNENYEFSADIGVTVRVFDGEDDLEPRNMRILFITEYTGKMTDTSGAEPDQSVTVKQLYGYSAEKIGSEPFNDSQIENFLDQHVSEMYAHIYGKCGQLLSINGIPDNFLPVRYKEKIITV